MKTLIKNAKIVTSEKIIEGGCCAFSNGIIDYVGKDSVSCDIEIDLNGNYLIPGFIDLHCHGGVGYEFIDASQSEMKEICDFHLSHGTTTLLATTLTASMEQTEKALDLIGKCVSDNPNGNLLGVHMEGPCLNPKQSGAQNPEYMLTPDKLDLKALKKKYPFIYKVSVAPELKGGLELGTRGKEENISMSIAHTEADFDTVEKAIESGYKSITHLYSGMNGVVRKDLFRVAGAVEAGLYFDNVNVEVIADGRHLPKELLKYIYKVKGADKICLVTDATRAAGLKEGTVSKIGCGESAIPIIVEDQVAKLLDKTSFAGSVASFDKLFENMLEVSGGNIVDVVKMCSKTPANEINLTDRGEIAVGKRADLLVIDKSYKIKKIFINGKEIK